MSCFFRKKRNRVHSNDEYNNHNYNNNSNINSNANNPNINLNANNYNINNNENRDNDVSNNIINTNVNETLNIRDYINLLKNRYTVNGNNEIRFNNRLILDDTDVINATDLTLSNYDVKFIISDINWLHNYNLKLVNDVNILLYDKLKLENDNLNLKAKINSLETNYIEDTKDILIENERLNNNIKSIINVNVIDELYLCIICMDNIRDIIINPCYHSIVCNKCVSELKCCPICRTDIKNTIKYYF